MASKREAAKLLRVGANLLQKYGWLKGAYGDVSSGFCATGALGAHDDFNGFSYETYVLATKSLTKVIGLPAATAGDAWTTVRVQRWNDGKRAESKEHVISKFRATARALEHGLKV